MNDAFTNVDLSIANLPLFPSRLIDLDFHEQCDPTWVRDASPPC